MMREGDTPLIHAARNDNVADVLALLADGADVDELKTDDSGCTALFIACQEGYVDVVEDEFDEDEEMDEEEGDGDGDYDEEAEMLDQDVGE